MEQRHLSHGLPDDACTSIIHSTMGPSNTSIQMDPCDTATMLQQGMIHREAQQLQDISFSGPSPDNRSDDISEPYAGTSSDSQVQVADSNSSKQPFVPCKVCGDKASGYHYGVTSCEGCKGFFRRSIQKQIEYRCLRDGKCMVIRLNRNRCQYCRFKKCLAVGMSRDSVRYGRVPKRSKSQDESNVSTTDGKADARELENKQLAIYDIILTISQAHHANCSLTEDKIKNLQRTPISLYIKTEDTSTFGATTQEIADEERLNMFQNLTNFITPTIQQVVEFAKRVPGFHDLTQDDQLILIKAGFYEMWLTRQARMFNGVEKTLTMNDGSVITQQQLSTVFTEELTTEMFDFAHSFTLLHLNDTEIGLFSGVVLATSDRPGLSDVRAVERIQDKLIEAIKLQISRNHSTEPHLFANVLMKLPELRMLGSKHTDVLVWIREQWRRLRLPPLFSEIYDIPKSEEEVQ